MNLHTLRLLARGRYAHVCVALIVLVLAGCAASPRAGHETAAIASAHPLATSAGQAMLERGGNAFDAAVAVAAALAVVEPYSSGLGGGGFFLLHRASDAREIMVDARETAPAGAKASDYFDKGERKRKLSVTSRDMYQTRRHAGYGRSGPATRGRAGNGPALIKVI